MSTGNVQTLTIAEYDRAADAYQNTLPLEHYMEGPAQATQREIALESFAQVRGLRPDVFYFSELLVQYFHKGQLRQVVPDNMVVAPGRDLASKKSYALEHEPAPTLVLEWVSDNSQGKDYRDSFKKYEKELKVPYALFFHPDRQDFRIYHHNGKKYEAIPANEAGRHLIPELELEVAVLDGWVRYWFRGKMLQLPAALQARVAELEEAMASAVSRAESAERQAKYERERAELAERQAREARELAERQLREVREQADRERAAMTEELARLRAILGSQPPAASGPA